MSKIFIISIFTIAALVAGCGFAQDKTRVDPYRDSATSLVNPVLNESSVQQEKMMIFNRQLSMLQDKLQKLETERMVLLQELETVRVEAKDFGSAKKTEVAQIKEYQAAVASSKARTAETKAKASIESAVIESEIDSKIASIDASTLRLVADLEANRSQSNQGITTKLIADIKAKRELEVARLNNYRRLETAKVNAAAVTEEATIEQPVLGSKNDQTSEVTYISSSNLSDATIQPAVRKVRKIYDVMYLFNDRKSWKHFNKFLTAYGVHDKFSVTAKETGEFVTYVGRFYSEKDALARKDQLSKKTKTDHAIIRKKEIVL
jgi:hypothetical protein